MSGPSIANTWLKSNDPVKAVYKMFEIYNEYNSLSDSFIDKIKKWWVEKVSYVFHRNKVKRIEISTAITLYDHPDALVFIFTRFLVALQTYIEIMKINIEEIISALFPNNMVSLRIKTDTISGNMFAILNYELTIRSCIVTTNEEDKINDKFAITSIEVDLYNNTFIISQRAYDTNTESNYNTSKLLYSKEFRLDTDGRLSNPNYILDKTLLDEDILYYRLIISQLMIFVGGFFDEITKLYFISINKE